MKSTNQSAGGSVGFSFGSQTGIAVSASVGRGKANGKDEIYTNTHIEAGDGLTLTSGGDVTLKGAVVSAGNVTGTVGGNLTVESLQDKSTYDSKQMTAGVSFTIGAGAASASFSQSKIESDYVSVREQSGIRAGDGGFQLSILGNTELKGGAITSTEAAVAEGKNTFSTASLTMSDVENRAEYKAKSMGVSAGSGGGGGGFGKESDDAKSVTYAGISGYAGNMVARTGDAESGIPKIFDVDKVQREIDAQVTITRAFGQVAPKAVADFADRQTQRYTQAKFAKQEIERQLASETDPDRRAQLEQARDEANQYLVADQNNYDKWREGGAYRVALHAALGGLAGGYTGALGAGTAATAAPAFNELQDRLERSLVDVGVKGQTANGIARIITGATAASVGGALTGGDFAGTGQALNVDSNNRQLHEEEIARIKRLAKGDKEREGRLSAAACALVKCYAQFPEGSEAYKTFKAVAEYGEGLALERQELSNQTGLFAYTSSAAFGGRSDEAQDRELQENGVALDALEQRVAAARPNGEARPLSGFEALRSFNNAVKVVDGAANRVGSAILLPKTLAEGTVNLASDAYGLTKDALVGPEQSVVGVDLPYEAKNSIVQSVQENGAVVTGGRLIVGAVKSLPGLSLVDAMNQRDPYLAGGALVDVSALLAAPALLKQKEYVTRTVDVDAELLGGAVPPKAQNAVSLDRLVTKSEVEIEEGLKAPGGRATKVPDADSEPTKSPHDRNAELAAREDMLALRNASQSPAGRNVDFFVNERAAAQELRKLESDVPGAHFVSRHGPETTLAQQRTRASSGLTPDGKQSKPQDASRFLTYQDEAEVISKAQAIYSKTGQVRVEVDLGRSIGEGYLKGGTAYTQTNRAIVRFDKNGRPFTAFPALR